MDIKALRHLFNNIFINGIGDTIFRCAQVIYNFIEIYLYAFCRDQMFYFC